MPRCLISFGANLGVPAITIRQAAEQIEQMLGSRLHASQMSRLVRTPAVGGPSGQPPFVNAVAALEVTGDTTAWDLWHIVREVEHRLGRVRQERWEARRIDVDVLLFDDQRVWTPQFKLPHPRMIMRRFILEPACDVAAEWLEPVSGWSIRQLAAWLTRWPASLVLISTNPRRDQALMDRAARIAGCEQVSIAVKAADFHPSQADLHVPPVAGRWLSIVPASELEDQLALQLDPMPRLACMLAPPGTVQDAAWEDMHRSAARWLGLCPSVPASLGSQTIQNAWPLNGPRYLLSTDDLAWAEHEIVAAMDAMDCPVEPMRSDL